MYIARTEVGEASVQTVGPTIEKLLAARSTIPIPITALDLAVRGVDWMTILSADNTMKDHCFVGGDAM